MLSFLEEVVASFTKWLVEQSTRKSNSNPTDEIDPMARKASAPKLTSAQVLRAAHLQHTRQALIEKLVTARGNPPGALRVVIVSTYLDDNFVEAIRPHVCNELTRRIRVIDAELLEIGVQPDPIPAEQEPEAPVQ